MDRLDPRIRSKLEAIQAEAKRSYFRLYRTNMVMETYEEPKLLCRKCGEAWPKTTEFFFRRPGGGFVLPCKACQAEQRAVTNKVKPCAFDGCTEPRDNGHDSYCTRHKNPRHRKADSQ